MMNMCKWSVICAVVWGYACSLSYGAADSYQQEQRELEKLKEALQLATEKRQVAEMSRNETMLYRVGMEKELASTKANYAEAEKRAEELLETMKQLDALSEVADLTEVVDTFTAVVENEKEKGWELRAELDSVVELRTAKTTKVANERETLAALDSDVAANYRKNVVEYPVLTILPERKLVLFTVPAESGIVSGDALLVKRGDNTIAVLRVEKVSDNQVTAKYTLAPGQELQLGDRVIHVKPHGS